MRSKSEPCCHSVRRLRLCGSACTTRSESTRRGSVSAPCADSERQIGQRSTDGVEGSHRASRRSGSTTSRRLLAPVYLLSAGVNVPFVVSISVYSVHDSSHRHGISILHNDIKWQTVLRHEPPSDVAAIVNKTLSSHSYLWQSPLTSLTIYFHAPYYVWDNENCSIFFV